MSPKFRVTQPVFMVAANRLVQPVVIKKILYDEKAYLVGFESAGELKIPESRLFASREEAEAYLVQFKKDRADARKYRDKLR